MNSERTPGPSGQTGDTVRIRRPSRVFTNDLGKNVWMGDVDPCEIELELEESGSTNPYDSGVQGDQARI